MAVTHAEISAARERIRGVVMATPCIESPALSELCGCTILAKLEYLQRTGSFKERGAANALMQLDPARRRAGVVAASAGNHALALAYHGRRLGIPVTVVMPRHAPLIKQRRCRSFGATIVLSGENIAEAKDAADRLVAERGLTYVHGFDGAEVIAGQGTIGLEMVEQSGGLDAIVCPIGGAGLIAGIGVALAHASPRTELIGVEPEHCASYAAALAAGRPVRVEMRPSLADGLAVPSVGERAFELARGRVSRVVRVEEEEIALAILRLVEAEKGVVEGAGAAPLAAFLGGHLDDLRGKRVGLVLAGGNIDPSMLGRVIEHGLVTDGRLTRFSAVISDRPGGLAEFASIVARVGASVKQIEHERAFASIDVSRVTVLCTVETRDAAHVEELHAALRDAGIEVVQRSSAGACYIA